MHRSRYMLLLVVVLVFAGIVGCAASPPQGGQPLPTAAVTESTGATATSITGRVVWGAEPLPGARVELRTADWRANPDAVLASTVAEASGEYVLHDAPSCDDCLLFAITPDGSGGRQMPTPVRLTAGQSLTGVDVYLVQDLELLEPASDAEVEPTPTLHWAALPEASGYRVFVIDAGTTELMLDTAVAATSLMIAAPLEPGRTYEWVVNALAAGGDDTRPLASGSRRFKVGDAPGATATPAG